MSRSVTPRPIWAWWVIAVIYSALYLVIFSRLALPLTWRAIPSCALLLAPTVLVGFLKQVPLLHRRVWVVYFFLACGYAAYGFVANMLALGTAIDASLGFWLQAVLLNVALVALVSLPVCYAIWAYAFRSPHLWGSTTLAA